MADQPRGRGRGRGRGRAAAPDAGAAAPPAAAPAPAPAPAAAPMGRGRARGRAAPPAAAAPAPVAAAAPVLPGRGRAAVGPQGGDVAVQMGRMAIGGGGGSNGGTAAGSSDGNGASVVPVGRGSVRPSRDGGSILVTKPKTISAKQGTDGQPVKLSANYFPLIKKKNWNLCKHHVDCNPPEDRTFVKKKLLRQHKDSFSGFLFDGTTLFTFANACPNGKPRDFTSRWKNGVNEDGSEMIKDYVLTVKFVGTVEQTDYQHLQIFNLVLRDCMEKMELTLIRRDYYDMKNKIEVKEHGLELFPGYSTSFLQCETDILLQAEIKYKVTRRDTAHNLFRRIFENSRETDPKKSFSTAVMGCVVMTTYNKKTYRIDEVDFNERPSGTFQRKERGGAVSNVSYADYFKERYGIKCNDMNQPMLISKSNAKDRRAGMPELVYLIPEFCIFTGLTDDMRKNFQLMKAVNETTCLEPRKRIDRLKRFNQSLLAIEAVKLRLESWGLELGRDIVNFEGRILPAEMIVVKDQKHSAGRDANWDRSLRTNNMLHSVNIDQWVIVVHSKASREAKDFFGCLKKAAIGMKYTINQPALHEISRDSAGDYVRGIMEARNKYNPQLVMCVVPNVNADRYSAIKRECIVRNPIPSQVILTKNMMEKKAMSVATKVAIQMNCKMGGAPWGVEIPLKSLMIIGYDVCHDPKDKRRSYGAMVATLDYNCVRWYSNVTRHSAGEELSVSFALNVMKCIATYQKANNGALPERIVIYRDGVGEGSIDHVLNIELKQTKDELEPLYKEKNMTLKIAFVVVTKRISTRIFMGDQNPPPGTVVDSCITSPFKYDFFLISQSVKQGTVTPTHYNVIEDTSGLKPNHMQKLTYKLTHLYYNWSILHMECTYCSKQFQRQVVLRHHVEKEHSNGSLSMVESIRPTETQKVVSDTEAIKKTESGKEPLAEPRKDPESGNQPVEEPDTSCSGSRKVCSSEDELEAREKTSPNRKKHNVCPQWRRKRFPSNAALERHSSTHTKEKRFVCHRCDFRGKGRQYFHQHVRTKHLECPYCRIEFHSLDLLNRHTRDKHRRRKKSKSGPKLFHCLHCGVDFSRHAHVYRHLRDQHNQCTDCGNQFQEQSALLSHMRELGKHLKNSSWRKKIRQLIETQNVVSDTGTTEVEKPNGLEEFPSLLPAIVPDHENGVETRSTMEFSSVDMSFTQAYETTHWKLMKPVSLRSGEEFSESSTMKKRVLTPDEGRSKRDPCPKISSLRSNSSRHVKSHRCKSCGKSFVHRKTLDNHIEKKHKNSRLKGTSSEIRLILNLQGRTCTEQQEESPSRESQMSAEMEIACDTANKPSDTEKSLLSPDLPVHSHTIFNSGDSFEGYNEKKTKCECVSSSCGRRVSAFGFECFLSKSNLENDI